MSKKWYAIYTKSKKERKVFESLVEKEIETYLPLQKTLRQWSDRKKWVEAPLFSGYVFVKVNEKDHISVLEVDNVVCFVKIEGKPSPIPEIQIKAVKQYLEEEEFISKENLNNLKIGQKAEVIAGNLKGLTGYITEIQGKNRLAIKIEAINQNLILKISKSNIKII